MTTPEQLAKLPKYARDEIESLRRALAEAHKTLAAYEGALDCDTIADPYAEHRGRKPLPLGNGTMIEFKLGANRGESIRAHLIDRGGGRRLEIQGDATDMLISPRGSNIIHVTTRWATPNG